MKRSIRRLRTRLYHGSRRIADTPAGGWGVAGISFAEATVVPVPLEAILAPLMLLHRDRAWRLAFMATAGCVAAAAVGYGVGWLFFETLGYSVLETFGWQEDFGTAQRWIETYGFWAVFIIGVTPIPFQTAMLLAGFTAMPFPLFLAAAALSRGARYFGLAAVILWIGAAPERFGGKLSFARLGRN